MTGLAMLGRVSAIGLAALGLPLLLDLHLVVGAAMSVTGSVLLAVVVSGRPSPLALSAGAIAALLSAVVAPASALAAAALFWGLVFLPRSLRARSLALQVGHGLLSVTGGALAALAIVRFSEQALAVQGAAALVAALAASAPFVLRVDDHVTFSFRALALRTKGVMRTRMLRAVCLRRGFMPEIPHLTRRARRSLDRAWTVLRDASLERAASTGVAARELDTRIMAYLCALSRALRAARTSRAREEGVSDAVLYELELAGEDLQARAEALAEVA